MLWLVRILVKSKGRLHGFNIRSLSLLKIMFLYENNWLIHYIYHLSLHEIWKSNFLLGSSYTDRILSYSHMGIYMVLGACLEQRQCKKDLVLPKALSKLVTILENTLDKAHSDVVLFFLYFRHSRGSVTNPLFSLFKPIFQVIFPFIRKKLFQIWWPF